MLIPTRRLGEPLMIGDGVRVEIGAPCEVTVDREELIDEGLSRNG